jgi:hypothetical protein
MVRAALHQPIILPPTDARCTQRLRHGDPIHASQRLSRRTSSFPAAASRCWLAHLGEPGVLLRERLLRRHILRLLLLAEAIAHGSVAGPRLVAHAYDRHNTDGSRAPTSQAGRDDERRAHGVSLLAAVIISFW